MKTEIHVHTTASIESTNTYEKIISKAKKAGLECLVICDHNTIKGAQELQKIAPFQVIIGEEITTSDGEIIGLFLTKSIPPKLPLDETINKIKQQAGLVYIPHPFDNMRRRKINLNKLIPHLKQIDLIEAFNGRTIFNKYNDKAKIFAKKYSLPIISGSDAHNPHELGKTYYEIDHFENPTEFINAITSNKYQSQTKSGNIAHFITMFHKFRNKLLN